MFHIQLNFVFTTKGREKPKTNTFAQGVKEVETWGIQLAWVTGDSWYSSVENLKFLRNGKVGFLFAIANNRRVSQQKGQYLQIQELSIPESGLMVYLKEFGWVKVF